MRANLLGTDIGGTTCAVIYGLGPLGYGKAGSVEGFASGGGIAQPAASIEK